MAQRKKVDMQRILNYPQALRKVQEQAARIEELESELTWSWMFEIQNSLDSITIAMGRREMDQGLIRDIIREAKEVMSEYMQRSLAEVRETEQGKGCEDFWYTQGKMDRELRNATGEDVLPWQERNDPQHLLEAFKEFKRMSAAIREEQRRNGQ